MAKFREFSFRNCLENRNRSRSEGPKGVEGGRSAVSCRQRSPVERPSAIFQTVSPLDFSHLRAEGVGYARHRNLPKRGDRSAYPTGYDDTGFGPVCATFLQECLPTRSSARGGRHPRSWTQETVSSALRAMGLDQHKRFHRYHRVLSRASWSSLQASRILLGLLLEAFVGEGPLILGIDETLERRWGK